MSTSAYIAAAGILIVTFAAGWATRHRSVRADDRNRDRQNRLITDALQTTIAGLDEKIATQGRELANTILERNARKDAAEQLRTELDAWQLYARDLEAKLPQLPAGDDIPDVPAEEEPSVFMEVTGLHKLHNPHRAGETTTWMIPDPAVLAALGDPFAAKEEWNAFTPPETPVVEGVDPTVYPAIETPGIEAVDPPVISIDEDPAPAAAEPAKSKTARRTRARKPAEGEAA